MKRVYLIVYDGRISQEGYFDYDDAKKYCEDRSVKRLGNLGWQWADENGRIYKIVEVKIV
jgi:hypothetical protein